MYGNVFGELDTWRTRKIWGEPARAPPHDPAAARRRGMPMELETARMHCADRQKVA